MGKKQGFFWCIFQWKAKLNELLQCVTGLTEGRPYFPWKGWVVSPNRPKTCRVLVLMLHSGLARTRFTSFIRWFCWVIFFILMMVPWPGIIYNEVLFFSLERYPFGVIWELGYKNLLLCFWEVWWGGFCEHSIRLYTYVCIFLYAVTMMRHSSLMCRYHLSHQCVLSRLDCLTEDATQLMTCLHSMHKAMGSICTKTTLTVYMSNPTRKDKRMQVQGHHPQQHSWLPDQPEVKEPWLKNSK